MRTLFLDYFAQSLVLGLAVAALLAATPLLQKRYSARWFCRAWLALAALLVLPLRAVLPETAPATVTLTPPPALLAAAEPDEAPAPQTAVPGPDTEHSTAPAVSTGQTAVSGQGQSAGPSAAAPETDSLLPEPPASSSDGEITVTVSHSPLAAFAPLDWLARWAWPAGSGWAISFGGAERCAAPCPQMKPGRPRWPRRLPASRWRSGPGCWPAPT